MTLKHYESYKRRFRIIPLASTNLFVGKLWFPYYSSSSCVDNSLDHSLRISSVSEVWDIHMFLVWCVQCMILHINVANIERSSGFLVSIFKLPAERTGASLSISIRQSVAPILRFHLAPRELPSLSRHEGGSSQRAGDGPALFFSRKHIFFTNMRSTMRWRHKQLHKGWIHTIYLVPCVRQPSFIRFLLTTFPGEV